MDCKVPVFYIYIYFWQFVQRFERWRFVFSQAFLYLIFLVISHFNSWCKMRLRVYSWFQDSPPSPPSQLLVAPFPPALWHPPVPFGVWSLVCLFLSLFHCSCFTACSLSFFFSKKLLSHFFCLLFHIYFTVTSWAHESHLPQSKQTYWGALGLGLNLGVCCSGKSGSPTFRLHRGPLLSREDVCAGAGECLSVKGCSGVCFVFWKWCLSSTHLFLVIIVGM